MASVNRPHSRLFENGGIKGGLLFALPPILVWGLFLAVFWPGLMSNDSISQWEQVLSGHFVDWHPAFDTLFIWLVTRAWFTPAAVAVVQILALAGLVAWALSRLAAMGVPRKWLFIADAVITLSPANATLSISIWKDVLYTVFLAALSLMVLEVVVSQGAWLAGRGRWVWLGLAAALTALFRQNGPLPALGGLGAVIFVAWRYPPPLACFGERGKGVRITRLPLRNSLLALVLAVGLWVGVHGPLFAEVGVQPSAIGYSVFVHQIAAHLAAGTPISSSDRAYLESLFPVKDWNYNCAYVDYTIWSTPPFNWAPVLQSPWRLLSIYLELARRDPGVNLRHMACESAFMWQINYHGNILRSPLTVKANNLEPNWVRDNQDGLVQASLLPGLVAPLSNYVYGLDAGLAGRWFTRTIWSPAIAVYLMILLVIGLMIQRRSLLWGLPFVPAALHVLSILLNAGSSDYRYLYPAALMVMLAWPLLWAKRDEQAGTRGDEAVV